MKKRLFFALVAIMALSACMRDDDWKLLKNPIHIQGQIDPSYGVPVAYGKMTFHDILGMLSSTYTGHIYDTTDVITIFFDTNMSDTLRNVTPGLSKGGSKVNVIGKDTTLEYSVNISLFDGADFNQTIGADNITIGDLWLNLRAIFKAEVPENVRDIINNENYVSSTIDNIKIFYTKHDGTEVEFTGLVLPDETLKHLIQGDTVDRDKVNLKSIINDMPKNIRVQFDYHFWLTDQFFFSYPMGQYPALKDSIDKMKICYNVDLNAEFPFDIRINRLPYSFEINLNGDSLPSLDIQQTLDSIARGLTVDLKNAKLSLAFDNNIPANLNMSAFLIDSTGSIIGDSLIRDTRISSAPIKVDPITGKNVSNGSTRTVIIAPIDAQRLRDLKKTRKIGFNLAIATGSSTGTVSMRRSDFLYIKAFVMVHPTATADIPLTNQGLIK
ncbi:MAG: hypothetical protein K6F72_00975 [Bacteroidales bacterium]|nr:hypothetical protein [Bacteroidales bacterium]